MTQLRGAMALALVLAAWPALAQTNPGSSPLSGAKGGTNNSFMQFTGPASSLKTFTLPNVSDTIALLGQAQSWPGAQSFNGAVVFGGRPWFDVKSAANGCAAAVGNGSTDDAVAIQCHIDYLATNFGGGLVFFPQGNYHVASTLIVTQSIWLEGSGPWQTAISVSTDLNPVRFQISKVTATCPSGNHYGGMEKMQVTGFNNAAATNATVQITDNCNVTIRDSILWFGAQGLFNSGVDGLVEGSFVWGYSQALFSKGANWYIRVKFDQPGATGSTTGYQQGSPISGLSPAENHFLQCDFTGTYTDSVNITDGSGTNAVTEFSGGVFSSPIHIVQAKVTLFSTAEFGSTTLSGASGFLNIVGSYAFTATTATGAGARSCAGNANLTC